MAGQPLVEIDVSMAFLAAPDRQSRRDRRAHHPRGARARHHDRPGPQRRRRRLARRAAWPTRRSNIGPPHAAKSYLNIEAILAAADATGADAVHPGYGFLSENADFADAVEAAGLVFVGPTGETIRMMGDKAAARAARCRGGRAGRAGLAKAGSQTLDEARAVAAEIGYPVMIKAVGRRRRTRHPRRRDATRSSRRRSPQASAEAKAAFGDGGLYLENFIARARHIEVQVLGDGATRSIASSANARCSAAARRSGRRRRRRALAAACARRSAPRPSRWPESVDYRGAGTLEYLYDEATRRLLLHRDEHPHPGRASGHRDDHRHRSRARDDPHRRRRAAGATARATSACAAMPSRCASTPRIRRDNFRPSPGAVDGLSRARRPRRRASIRCSISGYQVSPFYDSLLGKLIVWDETRDGALARMRRALGELIVEGVATTAPLHQALADDADGARGRLPYPLARRLASSRETRAAPHEGGKPAMTSRYSFGGDEHIFVEIDEEMSLEAFFKSLSITKAVRAADIEGVTEICPANASFQIKFDPDVITPDDLLAELKTIEAAAEGGHAELDDPHHRDPRALQRSLDARDPDALSRAPPGPGHDRHRIYRRDQPSRRRRRLRQGAFRRALVRLDGRLRRRPAVPLPDGRAATADPGRRNICARAPTRRS